MADRLGPGLKVHDHGRAGQHRPGGVLYVPAALRALIPPEARFTPELTPEGVLFRLVTAPPTWTARPRESSRAR